LELPTSPETFQYISTQLHTMVHFYTTPEKLIDLPRVN
jgi:hypothetical protein